MQFGMLPTTDDRVSIASYIYCTTYCPFTKVKVSYHGIFNVLLVDSIQFENIHNLASSKFLSIIYEL